MEVKFDSETLHIENGTLVGDDRLSFEETREADGENEKNAAASAELRGVWFSYLELNPQHIQKEKAYRSYVASLLSSLSELKITDLFVQVRPFADAIYPSKLFVSSKAVVARRGDTLPFDFLKVILEEASARGLRVHAWINPYRVWTASADVEVLQRDPVLAAWVKEDFQTDIVPWNGGLYLDPASEKARTLIVDGVHELLDTYGLSGIHIDDYFYPTKDASFDAAAYRAYLSGGGRLSLASFRRENVNTLVRALYAAVKEHDKDILFSISPSADIAKNETDAFADVRRWASEDGYCDLLLPQIYFGFTHETAPFEETAKAWRALCTNERIRLCAGLALYKAGTEDSFAGFGKTEWKTDRAILKKQVQLLRTLGFDGFSLYSLQFVNFHEKVQRKVLNRLKDVL